MSAMLKFLGSAVCWIVLMFGTIHVVFRPLREGIGVAESVRSGLAAWADPVVPAVYIGSAVVIAALHRGMVVSLVRGLGRCLRGKGK
ncbi:hypothetical protein H5T55_00770 [Candidatus Bipolaricaulota bacterium]|nr:hypothetical protein [Candidatus Bipolaricaulota bacterium]